MKVYAGNQQALSNQLEASSPTGRSSRQRARGAICLGASWLLCACGSGAQATPGAAGSASNVAGSGAARTSQTHSAVRSSTRVSAQVGGSKPTLRRAASLS